ncbi:MAG: tetratricopeptide repeat protein [Aestuariivita sp.]|nr:tetratricopeptide repeat protein [Aestuariivita sp.]MCY4203697.1 tetratricopeptide repeat protein [Aestuariivita sp.]
MRLVIPSLLYLLLHGAAHACPAVPDHQVALDRLLSEVEAAETESAARTISGKMWELWTDAPDEIAQALLDRGMAFRNGRNYIEALDAFNRLVAYCPDYAEGYNQRAFVKYLTRNYREALPDLNRALAITPKHIGAMSGKALSLMALGRRDEARSVLREAVDLNPWLAERRLLERGGALEPEGEDI